MKSLKCVFCLDKHPGLLSIARSVPLTSFFFSGTQRCLNHFESRRNLGAMSCTEPARCVVNTPPMIICSIWHACMQTFQYFNFQLTHAFCSIPVACTSFLGVIIGASVATASETASKVLGAINAGCFIFLGESNNLHSFSGPSIFVFVLHYNIFHHSFVC